MPPGHGAAYPLPDMVVQFWVSLLAAVCVSVLFEWRRRRATQDLQAPSKGWNKLWLRTRYVLSYPIPSRPLWAWAAGGAVSVLDLTVVAIYVLMAYATLSSKVQATLSPEQSPDKQMKVYARALGTVTNTQLGLALLPVPRSNFLAWLLPEAEFSALIKYHRWMSWGLLYTFCLHGAAYAFVWMGSAGILVALANTVNLWGLITLVVGVIVSLSSCAWMRRTNYKWFYRIHVIGAPLFLLALFIHDRISAYYIVPAMLLVVVDRVHRTWADLRNRTSLSIAQGSLAAEGGIITMKLPWKTDKGVSLRGTETLYLTIPALSIDPHPFSVAEVVPAVPVPSEVPQSEGWIGHTGLVHQPQVQIATVHAKVSGAWTLALRTHALLKPDEPLALKVEGPYKSSLQALPHSPVVVMIAGGIGITPLLALLRRWNREQALQQHSQCPHSGIDSSPADSNASTSEHQSPGCCERDVESLCCNGGEGHGLPQGSPGSGVSSSSSSRRSDSCWGSAGDKAAVCSTAAPHSPAQGGARGHTTARPPAQVYLVFSCKSLDEIRLLGPELLDAAFGPEPNKWLHLYVSYTGFELEASDKVCATCVDQGQQCILRPSLLLSQPPMDPPQGRHTPQGVCAEACRRRGHSKYPTSSLASGDSCSEGRRCTAVASKREQPGRSSYTTTGAGRPACLQNPPSRQLGLYLACACLAFAGSFWGLVWLAPIFIRYMASSSWQGPVESGTMLFVLAAAGAAVPPALLLYIHHALGCLSGWLRGLPPKVLFHSEEGLQLSKSVPAVQGPQMLLECCVPSDSHASEQGCTHAAGATGNHLPGLRVLPGYELDWDSKPQGKRVKVCRGRPQLTQLLQAIQQLHGNVPKACSSGCGSASSSVSKHRDGSEPLIKPPPKCDLIPVLIGGPEPMWASAQETCWQLNSMHAAFLEPHRVAHQH